MKIIAFLEKDVKNLQKKIDDLLKEIEDLKLSSKVCSMCENF